MRENSTTEPMTGTSAPCHLCDGTGYSDKVKRLVGARNDLLCTVCSGTGWIRYTSQGMSANPRSPESGDVPEQPDEWYCNKCGYFGAGGPFHQRGGNGLAERCEYMAGETLGSKQRREIARLTAELSTARERADRAEQDSKRLDELEAARLELRLRVDPDEMIQVEVSRRGDDEVLQEYTLRDAADALMVSTPTPTPDHA